MLFIWNSHLTTHSGLLVYFTKFGNFWWDQRTRMNLHPPQVNSFLKIILLIYFGCTGSSLQHTGFSNFSMWDLSSPTRDQTPAISTLGVQSLNHWAIREVLISEFLTWINAVMPGNARRSRCPKVAKQVFLVSVGLTVSPSFEGGGARGAQGAST